MITKPVKIITNILLTIKPVKLIAKKEFIATTFDSKDKAFAVYIASISQDFDIHQFWGAQIALLKVDKALTSIPSKYANIADISSKDLVAKLSKYITINGYAIDLIERH